MMRLLFFSLFAMEAVAFAPTMPQAQSKTSLTFKVQTIDPCPPRISSSALQATSQQVLERTELPEKLYFPKQKELPKVLGGLKVGLRQLVVITGASSGLGLSTAKVLANTGKYFVVMACRNVEKAKEGMYNVFNWRDLLTVFDVV